MPGAICAIRGGPSNQPTITTPNNLTYETGETIHFLYVVNLDFLKKGLPALVITVSTSLLWLFIRF